MHYGPDVAFTGLMTAFLPLLAEENLQFGHYEFDAAFPPLLVEENL